MKRGLFKIFHNVKLCPKICSIKYPWGWRSNDEILKLIKEPSKDTIYFEPHDNREYFHEYNFKKHSTYAYNVIYQSYLDGIDFLDENYTSPKLSFALNTLREISDTKDLVDEINVDKVYIIDKWLEHGLTKRNDKILGLFNKKEFIHELIAGGIGPEITNIWDQRAIKQKVKILYQSKQYLDIVEWERDLMLPEQNWSVSNINGIIAC